MMTAIEANEHVQRIHEAREVVRRTQAILDEATSARKAAAAAHEEATRRLLDAIDSAETAAAEEYPLWERERQEQQPPTAPAPGPPSTDLVGQCAPVASAPPQAALPAPTPAVVSLIREDLAEAISDSDLVDTLADLLARITDMELRGDYLADIHIADHPEEWPEKLRTATYRQHLVEDDDWTSEYARKYLDEVSQRANELFDAIAEWRRRQASCNEATVQSWGQWFEFLSLSVRCPEGLEAVYETRVDALYRYGDLTSRADGVETVECDFHLQTPLGNRVTVTRVIGPASRSVGGESIRDQLRVLAQAVYEDAVREAREDKKPAKRTGGKRKGATT